MKREIIETSDGSSSIYLPKWDEYYHSKHGAIQEAYHVFIKNGLDIFRDDSKLSIIEIGFGTGLNCFISYLEAIKRNLRIDYVGIEAFPLLKEEIDQLNYVNQLNAANDESIFKKIHATEWELKQVIGANFSLKKQMKDFKDITAMNQFELIYFDAFGPRVQPELWTEAIFEKMFNSLKKEGVLVTYSAKGSVRRAMQNLGFVVEKLPGPPGKREMLRGRKP